MSLKRVGLPNVKHTIRTKRTDNVCSVSHGPEEAASMQSCKECHFNGPLGIHPTAKVDASHELHLTRINSAIAQYKFIETAGLSQASQGAPIDNI